MPGEGALQTQNVGGLNEKETSKQAAYKGRR